MNFYVRLRLRVLVFYPPKNHIYVFYKFCLQTLVHARHMVNVGTSTSKRPITERFHTVIISRACSPFYHHHPPPPLSPGLRQHGGYDNGQWASELTSQGHSQGGASFRHPAVKMPPPRYLKGRSSHFPTHSLADLTRLNSPLLQAVDRGTYSLTESDFKCNRTGLECWRGGEGVDT